jgi:plasmid maintenance system antidote protein VapI
MNISKSIQYCLDDTGIMKKKLAQKLGVSVQTVSTLMKAEKCGGEMLIKLADAFDMQVSQFIALGE